MASKSIIDPICEMPAYNGPAMPMAGLKLPPEAFAGRTHSTIEPIYPYPIPDGAAAPTVEPEAHDPGDLVAVFQSKLESSGSACLTPSEFTVLRGWMHGKSERDSAAELNWTADAVRAVRTGLLRRIQIKFGPATT